MVKRQSEFSFKGMALAFKLRDLWRPRRNILAEAGIRPGFHVLDFGCGPGGYILPLAEFIGSSGQIYALDVNPLAIRYVENLAFRRHLKNVRTIRSGGKTGLPDGSIDAVLLYDVLHHLSRPGAVLKEMRRVLKPGGVLSVSDHHLTEGEITAGITGSGLFQLGNRGKRVYNFRIIQGAL